MPTVEFSKHRVLFELQPELNIRVATWVATLLETYYYSDLYDLYEDLRQLILDPSTKASLGEDKFNKIRYWLDHTPVRDVVGALYERGGWSKNNKVPPKVTPEQLEIIEETQREVGVDFSPVFDQLSSWQGDVICKGLVVVSEVQKQTGNRHFKIRDLRRSIRQYIQDNYEEVKKSQKRE